MYKDGYENILSVDYSEQVIEEMNEKSKVACPGLKYEVCDVFNMTYKDEAFDLVLDKGCLDAIYPELNEENKKNID
jgi:ubiquinone/menaquinone biosynthesis C-methylase UbiE